MSQFSDSDTHLDRLPASPRTLKRPDLHGFRNSSLRSSVRAVTAAHRFTTVSSHNDDHTSTPDVDSPDALTKTSSKRTETTYHWLSNIGHEPGVDVSRKADQKLYGQLLQDKVRVTVVDYWHDAEGDAETDGSRVEIPGEKFDAWLNSKEGKRPGEDAEGRGKPKSVRWINVDGMNWDVVKTLTLKYSLHPLAVEDALRANRSPRSKVDFYRNHLYLQLLVQHMHAVDGLKLDAIGGQPGATASDAAEYNDSKRPLWRQLLGLPPKKSHLMRLPEGVEGVFEPTVSGGFESEGKRPPAENDAHRMVVDHLSAKYMVPIRRGVMSCFMTRDGVLITVAQYPCTTILAPIYNRLEDGESLLRRSADASMLMQALVDVVVDISLDITRAFEAEILKMEAGCLVDPQMETVRHLHVLSSQLIRLRRTLSPLLHVLYNLRDQDVQRSQAAAAVNPEHVPRTEHALGVSEHDSSRNLEPTSVSKPPIPFTGISHSGFVSNITKVYLGDVIDHLEIVLSSVDQFVATADHLTDYVFNMLSFVTNASMERLSIVTVVFLPLTFIASYFGMNFTEFPEINGSSLYFWKVAAPLTFGFFVIFSFGYLRRGAQTIERRVGRWRRQKLVQKRVEARKTR